MTQLTQSMRSERRQGASAGAIPSSGRPGVSTLDRRPARRFAAEDLAPADRPDLPDPPTSEHLHRVADDLDRILGAGSADDATPLPPIATALFPEALTPGQALLERAESISTEERIDQLLRAARPDAPAPSPAPSPSAPATSATIPVEHRPPRPTPPVLSTPPWSEASGVVDTDESPGPTSAAPPAPPPAPVAARPTSALASWSPARAVSGDFWTELAQLEADLPPAITIDAPTQLIVGPLDVALPLARRTIDGRPDAELTVLTDEAALAGIPNWKLAENSRDLLGRLTHWTEEGRRCVGVIEAGGAGWADGSSDAPVLTARLMGVIERVCAGAVVGQLRLALRTLPDLADLADLAGSLNVPLVLDLAAAPSAAELDAAIDAGVPIASICGRPLTPALVMALRQR